MAHHYVNQLIHTMWSTNKQQHIIAPSLKGDLYAYITAIVKAKNGRVFAVGGADDHIHLLTLLPPEISLSSLIGHVKACSSKWLKLQKNGDPLLNWQNGYLAISTQEDKLDSVCSYIRADEMRHQTKSYTDELTTILKLQNIEYNEKYFLQNSHSKIYVHMIWSTFNRAPHLEKCIRHDLYNQMTDVISRTRGIVHAIGGVEDHVHILVEMPRDKSLSDLIRNVKTTSTHWLKRMNRLRYNDFQWQVGYGAFTMSYSSIGAVKLYIERQEERHRKLTFQEEWDKFGEIIRSQEKISLS